MFPPVERREKTPPKKQEKKITKQTSIVVTNDTYMSLDKPGLFILRKRA